MSPSGSIIFILISVIFISVVAQISALPISFATPVPVPAAIKVESVPIGVYVDSRTNNVYVANEHSNTVSVINSNDKVVANIEVGTFPHGISGIPTSDEVFVTNMGSNTVTVIDTTTNKVIETFLVGKNPRYVASGPSLVDHIFEETDYVVNSGYPSLSLIHSLNGNHHVVETILLGNYSFPSAVAVNANTDKVYVTDSGNDTVSVIKHYGGYIWKLSSIPLERGAVPHGIAVDTNVNRTYVAETSSGVVSVIDGNIDMIIDKITVGGFPWGVAFNPKTKLTYVTYPVDNRVSDK